jgi:hypothetical protein
MNTTGGRVILAILALALSVQVSATTILILNKDAPGEGFNDPTDAVSIPLQRGNNPGTTLGAMRLKLFEEAARVWEDMLQSSVVITLGSSFDPLLCDENGVLLGRAVATSSHADFIGAEPGVAYTVALAESISRLNLNGGAVEVSVTFNSDVDTDNNCLGSGGFYYGLDAKAPPGTVPLFPVVLHELAHGLGFSNLADVGPEGTGEFNSAGGYPDSYSRNLFDLETGKSWDEMNNIERKTSALNGPWLVWKGANATAARVKHLAPAPGLVIIDPVEIAGEFEAVPGEEPNAVIPLEGVTSSIIDGNLYEDLDGGLSGGCKQFHFSAPFTERIVMLDANACAAYEQARWAQVEGAVGVLIVATTETGLPDVSGQFVSGGASIPYIGVEKSVGTALRAHLDTAKASIGFLTTIFQGDNEGMIRMHAPVEYREGSSAVHWSVSASPDLLMHPFLGDLEYANVDLTAAAFRDIGWAVNIPGEAQIMIFKNGFEE